MSTQEQEDIKAIRDALDRLASAQIFETSKAIYDLGWNNYQRENYAMAISLFERIVELDDPFYSTQALFLIANAYRRRGRAQQEIETYKRISKLPQDHKRFADGASMGNALLRIGDSEAAKQHYLSFLNQYGKDASIEANLAEVLLVRAEFKDCVEWSSRLAEGPMASNQIIGRLLKGSALYFLGDRASATEEFRWIANFLLSLGSIPPDFNWDFGDSKVVLDRLDVPEGSLIIQLLSKRLPYQDFAIRWAAFNPALPKP